MHLTESCLCLCITKVLYFCLELNFLCLTYALSLLDNIWWNDETMSYATPSTVPLPDLEFVQYKLHNSWNTWIITNITCIGMDSSGFKRVILCHISPSNGYEQMQITSSFTVLRKYFCSFTWVNIVRVAPVRTLLRYFGLEHFTCSIT
jgi:hypothetical protein